MLFLWLVSSQYVTLVESRRLIGNQSPLWRMRSKFTPLSNLRSTLPPLRPEAPYNGLSSPDVDSLRTQHGRNVLTRSRGTSLSTLFIDQFRDKLSQLMLFVAILSSCLAALEKKAGSGVFTEPAAILAVLLSNALAGMWQISTANKALASLQELQPHYAQAYRDGAWGSILSEELVVFFFF